MKFDFVLSTDDRWSIVRIFRDHDDHLEWRDLDLLLGNKVSSKHTLDMFGGWLYAVPGEFARGEPE